MARASQTPGNARWNPYTIGEMRKIIKDELEKLATNETYRNSKVGTYAFKEAKGKSNWNIYLYSELFERFTKRFDDTIRGTYTNTIQTLGAQTTSINNITQQNRTFEGNMNKFLKSSFENVLTNIIRNTTQFDEFKKEFESANEELKTLGEGNKSDIRKATKILKDSYAQELSGLKDELTAGQAGFKDKLASLEESLKGEMKSFNTKSEKLVESVTSTLGDSAVNMENNLTDLKNSMMDDLGNKIDNISETATNLNTELTVTKKDVTEFINDRMLKHQDTMNNVLEDQQKLTVSEISDHLKAQVKQNSESFENQAIKLAQRIDDLNNGLESRLNEMNEGFNQKLQDFRDEYDKNFEREMSELRATLSTIRADIEIMKTLLASLAK